MRQEVVKATSWGVGTTFMLGLLILVGSRNLATLMPPSLPTPLPSFLLLLV